MESAEARARPILGEVCAQIADVQVRNRGTIGGNVCSNDPTNHLPPLMVALGATMHIVGANGERTVPAEEFFLGVYMTAAGPGRAADEDLRARRARATASPPSRSARTARASSTRPRRSTAARASRSAASTPCRSLFEPLDRRAGRGRGGCAFGSEPRSAVRRPRVGRLPPPPRRGRRRARGRGGDGKELMEPASSKTINGRRSTASATSVTSRRAGC